MRELHEGRGKEGSSKEGSSKEGSSKEGSSMRDGGGVKLHEGPCPSYVAWRAGIATPLSCMALLSKVRLKTPTSGLLHLCTIACTMLPS